MYVASGCILPAVVEGWHEFHKFLPIFIDKADELPVHNRKGVGNQKEKGGGAS